MKISLILFLTMFFLSSCEKNIDFDLENAADALVVDAQVENGQAPMVVLTKSFDYFSTISPAILTNSFVHSAVVTISNRTLTHRLKEYPLSFGNGYTVYYYTLDSANLSTAFVGEFNKTYSLNIKSEGQEYNATTKIPLLTKFPDSLWFKVAPLNPDTNKRILMCRITDPVGLGNYTRYFTKTNSGNFLPGFTSAYDDAVVDGTTFEIQVTPGIDRNSNIINGENYFNRGDTVTVKLCNIDKAAYTFWSTWEFAQQSIGNPFAQPNKVIGNISNGALGAFCGYAAWFKTIIAK